MTLLEALSGLLSLVIFVSGMLGLVYAVVIYGHTPIEPKKIVAWWKRIARGRNRVTPPAKPEETPRWHDGFDHPV
jgi:hypothetical protein